jgi:putative toxin-antitoxin system antitoxin component (TIGR02293 family)
MPVKPKKSKNKYVSNPNLENTNLLSEPAVAYVVPKLPAKVIILANAVKKAEYHMTSFEKIDIVRDGIIKKDLELLKEKAALDYSTLAKILGVTRATLINKPKNERFNASLSEKILSIADLYSFGFEVFGDEKKFNQWMGKPNQAIGGHIPYDIIDNQYGREEVKNIIGRIAYGVYS